MTSHSGDPTSLLYVGRFLLRYCYNGQDGGRDKGRALQLEAAPPEYAILPNEPNLFLMIFCCIKLIYRNLCRLERCFSIGFVFRNEPNFTGFGEGLYCLLRPK
jgi:hypothetical protein